MNSRKKDQTSSFINISSFDNIKDLVDSDDATPADNWKHNKKQNSGTKLYSTLENEYKRLKRLDSLLSKKMLNIERYPQTKILIKQQANKAHLMKEKIINRIKSDESSFQQKMARIWNTAFK